MKRIILFLAVAMAAVSCSSSKQTTLTFNVADQTAKEIVLVYNGQINPVVLDESGSASVDMSGVDAVYAKLFYGRNFKWIYVEKGDVASVSFNGKDFNGTFSFDGSVVWFYGRHDR